MSVSAQVISQQQGAIWCWSFASQPEMQIGYVASQMHWQASRHVGLELVFFGYDGSWTSKLYDTKERTTVYLYVFRIEGNANDFTYIAWRVPGRRMGDRSAAQNQEPEWFEIHVVRSSRKDAQVTATWKRIPEPHKA